MTESQSLTSTSVDDHNLSFKRRRYGNKIYTWVYVESGEQWLSLGDPWPCATPAKTELLAAIHATLGIKPMTYKMIEDPGHAWLRVPQKEIVGMTFSKFSYADGEFAYLEEDCDAPKFMEAKSISHEDITTTFIEFNCFVRRLGGLPREFILKEQAFEECGCCGHYHRATFRGDCRDDSERFTIDEIPEGSEVIDLESLIAEED